MSRTKKKYANGQSRGVGHVPQWKSRSPKDYHKQAIGFHGGEAKLEEFLAKLKKE